MGLLFTFAKDVLVGNFLGYLISCKIEKVKEKAIIQDIEEKIISFNRKYDDTVVDSNFFVEFISSTGVMEEIFNGVFASYKADTNSLSEEISNLTARTLHYINEKKRLIGYPIVKRGDVISEYYADMYNCLISIRDNLLGLSGQALAASIVEGVVAKTSAEMDKAISANMDNSFLVDEKIQYIKQLLNAARYEVAEEEIENIFIGTSYIPQQQKINLLYYKAKIHLYFKDMAKVERVKSQITRLDDKNRYIFEIDYMVSWENNDEVAVDLALDKLKECGLEDEKIALRRSSLCLLNQDYGKALVILLNEEGELKTEFENDATSNYQLGIIKLNNGDFKKAVELLSRALEIEYNIAYDFNLVTARCISFFQDIKGMVHPDNAAKIKAEELIKELNRTYYFIESGEKQFKEQYWNRYLSLLSIVSLEDAVNKYEEIEADIKNVNAVIAPHSESLYLLYRYKEAIPFLEKLYRLDTIFLIRLCNCYRQEEEWESLFTLLQGLNVGEFDEEGVIYFCLVEYWENKEKLDKAIETINGGLEIYDDKAFYLEQVLRFSKKYSLDLLMERISELILSNKDNLSLNERVQLSKVLYNVNKMHLIRQILDKDYESSHEAIDVYLASFGEPSTKSPDFSQHKSVVCELYDNGLRYESILRNKMYIEFNSERYKDAIKTLEDYKQHIGDDVFYHLNVVQCNLFGKLDTDASQNAYVLLGTEKIINHVMAAQYFSYKGRWGDAKGILLKAYYSMYKQIDQEAVSGFVRVFFMNRHIKEKVNFEIASDDTVVVLKKDDKIYNYAIHSNGYLIISNGEERFGCYNYSNSSYEGIYLKASAKVGRTINIEDDEYEVIEVLCIHNYLFRYFLNKLITDYPDNKTVIPIMTNDIDKLADEMKHFLKNGKHEAEYKLDSYNFGIKTSTPLSYLSEKDGNKLKSVIEMLIEDKSCLLYSSISDTITSDEKYVITLNSMLVIDKLGYLESLISISEKIYITSSTKLLLKNILHKTITQEEAVSSMAFYDDEYGIVMSERTEDEKDARRLFWARLLQVAEKFSEVEQVEVNTDIFDVLHEICEISEFESIQYAIDSGVTCVDDDLFISNILRGTSTDSNIVNGIGLLFYEDIIDVKELLNIVYMYSDKGWVNIINSDMLYKLYLHIVELNGGKEFDVEYSKLKAIFNNLFCGKQSQHHMGILELFRQRVIGDNKFTLIMYDLVQEPLGLVSSEEMMNQIWANLKIQIVEESE